jgi:hypothetical protein
MMRDVDPPRMNGTPTSSPAQAPAHIDLITSPALYRRETRKRGMEIFTRKFKR